LISSLTSRRRNLAAEAEERAHAPRLSARRPALYVRIGIRTIEELRQADH
jgi:hypothetical protein